jgi:hypothetical protein
MVAESCVCGTSNPKSRGSVPTATCILELSTFYSPDCADLSKVSFSHTMVMRCVEVVVVKLSFVGKTVSPVCI